MRAHMSVLGLAILLALVVPVHAQDSSPRPPSEVDADLLAVMKDLTLESFIAQVLTPIRRAREPGRLTREEVNDSAVIEHADQRASEMTKILRYDLDGDGSVPRAEAEKAIADAGGPLNRSGDNQWRDERAEKELECIFEADSNADERIEFAEILAWANGQPDRRGRNADLRGLLLDLDANGDGTTTIAEAEARARQVFARYDLDGDGLIDETSRRALNKAASKRKSQVRLEVQAERCAMPPAARDARIVLFTTQTAQAVSSVAVDGLEAATLTAPLTIEPGTEKIYLVLAAGHNMVWRIDGAVERLTNVVLLERRTDPQTASAAVTGVDRSIVSWAPEEECALIRGSDKGGRTAAIFTAIHGRSFDAFDRVHSTASVAIPSMELVGIRQEGLPVKRTACRVALGQGGMVFSPEGVEGADLGPCDWLRAEAELNFPGGVVDLDPSSVVARKPALRYDVLPSPFGFRKALDEGVLTDLTEGTNIRFRLEKPLAYFPPTASRKRQIVFELAPGVPMPRGPIQRYCVLDSTGKLIPTETHMRCEQLR